MSEYTKASCDVLVLGGGIAGLTCAAALKEQRPDLDVLVCEKNFAGYSGKANRGGGVLQYFDFEKTNPDQFVAFHDAAIGDGLGDKELMKTYVEMNHDMLDKLVSWGVNLPREEDGGYHVMPTGPFTCMICVDLDITLKVRRTAEKLGVRFMDKTVLAELAVDAGRVNGAAVYSLLDGAVTLISAKSVVLATGSQNYRIGSMWSSGRGDGIAAAYRAGAVLRNCEFGNFAQLVKVNSHNEIVFGENFMYNAKGEFITRNFRQMRETDINSNAIREWFTQMRDGNGPVHLDYGPDAPEEGAMERLWNRPYGKKFRLLNDETGNKVDKDLEVCPMFIGEQSPIRTGHDMQTSIDGLYAVGDVSYCGTGLPGAVPAPPGRNRGSGILNGVFSGLQAAKGLAGRDYPVLPEAGEAVADMVYTDLHRLLNKAEGVTAKEVIAVVQQAMAPVELSVWLEQSRMEQALAIVEKAKAMLPDMKADDWHGVNECREAAAMVLSAELHYRTAMLRKESRGWFLREDYPEKDDENWKKYITVQKVNDEMTFGTEPVPVPLVPITEEERQSPLFKYYDRPMTKADPEKYKKAAQMLDPADAIQASEMNRLFDDGYLPGELGWTVFPDGSATLANITPMPGVTPEMFDWWFAWHGLAPMRYKIWNREQHYYCLTQNPEKALDKSLSMKERYWDTTHDVEEDCNMGKEKLLINFRNPADIGFDPEKLKDFKGTIVCAGNEQSPTIMCHFVRPTADGCELRTRFWMGQSVINGKPKCILPPGVQFPAEPVKALLMHNIKEFTHLASILPELYEEFGKDF